MLFRGIGHELLEMLHRVGRGDPASLLGEGVVIYGLIGHCVVKSGVEQIQNFNWVRARSKCSLRQVFIFLAEMVGGDVNVFNEIRTTGEPAVFKGMESKFIVARGTDNIVFELGTGEISVRRGQDTPLFAARPRLDQDGECLLQVNGETLKLWQVSRKALEEFFFG